MLMLTIALMTLGQAKAETPLTPEGHWRLVGNGKPGYLVISMDADGAIKGSIYDETIEGSFDPATRRITIRRLVQTDAGMFRPVQEFKGELRIDEKPGATRVMSGKFRSVFGPEWGATDVDYEWSATALSGTVLNEELKDFEGRWEVVDSQSANARHGALPRSSPLTTKGALLEIRNHQVFHEDKLVATLANELRLPATLAAMRPNRKPLMLVLPNGAAYLVAYDGRARHAVEIVFPHTTGNVGAAHFLYWKRRAPDELPK